MSSASELKPEARAALVELLALSYNDPRVFILRMLQVLPWTDTHGRSRTLRRWQEKACAEIKAKLLAGETRLKVLIRSCHGAGKTFFAAALVLWWVFTRHNSRTLTLAPTWPGVEELLWPEIEKLYNGSLFAKLQWGRVLATKLDLGKTWYAIGASSDKPAHLEGHHSDTAALRVVDEAKAVEKEIFDATEGMLDAPETLDLWISTPSIEDGEFFARDTSADPNVIRLVVDVDELIDDGIPGKAEWKADRLEKWGEDDADYQSRVLAHYVSATSSTLFPSAWVERAMEQEWEVSGPLRLGQDVAGSTDGDENALALCAGPDAEDRFQVRSLESWHERDTMISKGHSLPVAQSLAAPVAVDVVGLGKGVADALGQDGVKVEEYRSSDPPRDNVRFLNRKAEDAWQMRDRLEKTKLRLPGGEVGRRLKAQMRGMKFKILASGKKQVIDPSDSPDLFDAVLMGTSAPREDGIAAFYARKAAESGKKDRAA